jgi:hypothetical protein
MTSSPSNRFHSFCAASIICLIFSVATASAQDKPRSLVPNLNSSKSATDELLKVPEKPASSVFGTQPNASNKPASDTQTGLVVKSLAGLDAASVGTLDAASGSFGTGMWAGTAPERVVTLLTYLPVSPVSPAMQDLYRRLLLSTAAIPQGLESPTELLALRLSKLAEAGQVIDATLLAEKISPAALTDDVAIAYVNLQFLQGRNEDACRQVTFQKSQNADRFWVKADVFCDILKENFEQAEIGMALLEERGEVDQLFLDLFDRLAGGNATIGNSDVELTPLHFAMVRQANPVIPYSFFEQSGHDVIWARATQENAPIDERTRAAYQSLTVGSMGPELVRRFILDNALEQANEEGDALAAIAKLYRKAVGEKDKEAVAAPLSEIWQIGFEDDSYFAATQLSAPLLGEVPAANQSDEFEIDAVRLLLAGNDAASAAVWERVARRAALRGTPDERLAARKKIDRVDAYMLISGAPGIARWNANTFDAQSFVRGSDLERGENIGLFLTILDVFDQQVPTELWSEALDLGQVAQPRFSNLVIEKNLVAAAEAGRTGETIALALTALGQGGPSSVSLTTMSRVLSSLKEIGLEKEARSLALEAAILRDL